MGGAVNDEDIAALMAAADRDRDGQVGGSGIVVSMWRSFLFVPQRVREERKFSHLLRMWAGIPDERHFVRCTIITINAEIEEVRRNVLLEYVRTE